MLNCKLSGDNLKNTQSLALFSMCHFADIVLDLQNDFVLMDKENNYIKQSTIHLTCANSFLSM